MKTIIASLALVLVATASALAQQNSQGSATNRSTTSSSVGTPADNGSTNAARPNSAGTYPNNGTTPAAGTGNTVDQNYGSGSAVGPASNGSITTTATDARSSTTTSPTTVKAKKRKPKADNQQ